MKLGDTREIESASIEYLKQCDYEDVTDGLKLFADDALYEVDENQEADIFIIDVDSFYEEEEKCSVKIQFSKNEINGVCDCSIYKTAGHCKHIPAAMMEIMHLETDYDEDDIIRIVRMKVIKKMTTEVARVSPPTSGRVIPLFAEQATEIRWRTFITEPGMAFMNVNNIFDYSDSSRQFNKVKLVAENKEVALWNFEFKAGVSTIYYPEIKYDKVKIIGYRCTCKDASSMCVHVKTSFDLLQSNGNLFFARLRDWSVEKEKMLAEYGLTLEDEEVKQIEFVLDYFGNLQMMQPPWLWAKDVDTSIAEFKKRLAPRKGELIFSDRPTLSKNTVIDFQVGLLFNLISQHFKIGFELETIKVFDKPTGKQFKKISIHNVANLPLLKELPDDVYNLILSLTDEGVKKHLTGKGYGYISNYSNPWSSMPENAIPLISKYYLGQLQKLWPYIAENTPTFLLREGNFSNANIKPVKLSVEPLQLSFFIEEDGRFITIRHQLLKKDEIIDQKNFKIHPIGIFVADDTLFLPANIDDLDIIRQFKHGFIKIPVVKKLAVITDIIPALQKKYDVQLPQSFQLITVEVVPKPQILLKEYNTQYLMLQPQFLYDDIVVDFEKDPHNILQTMPDGSWQVMQRDAAKEKSFFEISVSCITNSPTKSKTISFIFLSMM